MYRSSELHVTPEDLLGFAWSAPMRDLAARLGISDVGLRKLLHGYGIVTPPPLESGEGRPSGTQPSTAAAAGAGESGRIPLDARFRGVVADSGRWPVDGPFATALVPESLEELRAAVLVKTRPVSVPRLVTKVHPGVGHIIRKDEERAAKQNAGSWLAEAPHFGPAFWKRQLRLFNALFLALDAMSADGTLNERDGKLVASVVVGDTRVAIGLSPARKVRRERFAGFERPASDLPPSTPLRLTIGARDSDEIDSWQDEPDLPLKRRLREIVAAIVAGERQFRHGLREQRDWQRHGFA